MVKEGDRDAGDSEGDYYQQNRKHAAQHNGHQLLLKTIGILRVYSCFIRGGVTNLA